MSLLTRGSIETIDRYHHADPIYEKHGVIHLLCRICQGRPGLHFALANATLPYALELANNAEKAALKIQARQVNTQGVC